MEVDICEMRALCASFRIRGLAGSAVDSLIGKVGLSHARAKGFTKVTLRHHALAPLLFS